MWSISHSSSLFLAHDPIKRTKEIRHEYLLSIVTNDFTRAKPSEYTFFVLHRDRLCGPRLTRLRNHISREQVDPDQQLRVPFERHWQRRNMIHRQNLKGVRRLYVPRRATSITGASFTCFTIHKLSHIPLHTSIQTVDQIKWGVPANPIVCGVDRVC